MGRGVTGKGREDGSGQQATDASTLGERGGRKRGREENRIQYKQFKKSLITFYLQNSPQGFFLFILY